MLLIAILLTTGSGVIGILGFIHLMYTFRSDRFEPRDDDLGSRLRSISPVLTSETTMWKAWIGFNASHSLGAMLFAAFYGYLATAQLNLLLSSPFLVALSLVTLGSYLVLARLFWFSAPFRGIAFSTSLFVLGYAIAYI